MSFLVSDPSELRDGAEARRIGKWDDARRYQLLYLMWMSPVAVE